MARRSKRIPMIQVSARGGQRGHGLAQAFRGWMGGGEGCEDLPDGRTRPVLPNLDSQALNVWYNEPVRTGGVMTLPLVQH